MADITYFDLREKLSEIESQLKDLAFMSHELVSQNEPVTGMPFVGLFAIFLLACFVGYYVVWNVTPALHSPLMAVTNAVSSVIIVGAMIAAAPADFSASKWLGFFAVILASINIFGGFIVTQRMLSMFKKKAKGGKS